MICVNGVTKVYQTTQKKGWLKSEKLEKVAVKDISIELNPGEIIGLLGLNGAGKTTTIKMISTLLEPTSGSITIDQLDTVKDRRKILERINMITSGERMLYWRLTGRENLYYFGRLYGIAEKEIVRRTENLLEEMGLKDAADTPVERYSKGMKQRLQIARGLINDPRYLLLDEPTLGLDAPIARQLRGTIKHLAKYHGKGILLTSHYLQEVEELCDRIYLINEGRMVMSGPPNEIVRNIAGYQVIHIHLYEEIRWDITKIRQNFDLPENAVSFSKIDEDLGVVVSIKTESIDNLMPRLLSWLINEGILIKRITTEKPSLEDAIVLLSEGGLQSEKILANI